MKVLVSVVQYYRLSTCPRIIVLGGLNCVLFASVRLIYFMKCHISNIINQAAA